MRRLGLFIVGPAVLTLGLAVTVYYTQAAQLLPSLHSFWLVIHVSVAILSAALFTIAFSVTILFLLKARRATCPPRRPNFMESLPDAAPLDRTAYRRRRPAGREAPFLGSGSAQQQRRGGGQ